MKSDFHLHNVQSASGKVVRSKERKAVRSRERKAILYGLLFTLPAILGFVLFTAGPMIASFVLSLTDYSVFKDKTNFIGLDNYWRMFSGEDSFFYKSLWVTIYYVLLKVPATIIVSFAIAMLLNMNVKGRALFRTIIYLPSIVPAVGSAMIWLWLLNPDLGLVNTALSWMHLPTSKWLFSEGSVIPSVVLTTMWGIGGTVVIFLAGLSSISKQYYEAVDVDGGGWYHKLIHITIPMVSPTIFFNTVMTIIGSFQVFNEAYILTEGGPNNSSLFYVYYLWRTAFRDTELGYASALGWVMFIIIILFTYYVFKSSKSLVYYEGGDTNERVKN
jgi:multiple sugar transport system permease protein